MKFYKVVRSVPETGKYCSIVAQGNYSVEYGTDIVSIPAPGTGGLFVFGDLTEALRFCAELDHVVFECEVTNPQRIFYREVR